MLALVMLALTVADRPDRIVADFESPTYGAGWVTTGSAFGEGPAKGALHGQMAVGGYEGERLVNSFHDGDNTVGTLTSPDTAIDRKHVKFLIGGGRYPDETALQLIVGGKVVRSATGHDSEYLRPVSWDVSEFEGKTAQFRVIDNRKGGWGHINVDQIVLCDTVPPVVDERDALLAKAEAGDRAATDRASKDPNRPTYHILPPGNWLNDPNGPIFHGGYYHMFYQHNPYGDDWGNMHWGHVRSKDLVTWERQPIALWPSKALGEDHVFSGCATVSPKGQLMLFYTSIGPRKPEQWVAIPEDDSLIQWKKHPKNPILTEDLHGDVKVHEWRDPFIFKASGKTYMALGGNLNAGKGGQGVVNVYRAEDDELTKWKYLGVLFQHPDKDVANVECPLFFPLGDKWVLIVSQGRPVHWFVGALDEKTMKFTAETRGDSDRGNFYAPNVTTDKDGRALLWGWVPDFPKGRGWNGCLTLPRVLSVDSSNRLRFDPSQALTGLRISTAAREVGVTLNDRAVELGNIKGDSLELLAKLDLGTAKRVGLKVRRSPKGEHGVVVAFDGKSLEFAGTIIPLALPANTKEIDLRIFIDRTVVEVYVPQTGEVVTKVVLAEPGDLGAEAFASGGTATLKSLEAWPLKTIWAKD